MCIRDRVHADKAQQLKKTGKGNIMDIIEVPTIFTDIKKGFKASNKDLEDFFGTIDVYEIAAKIIQSGEIQMPASSKEREREIKKRQIIDWLASSCSDAKGLPIPADRIESAMKEAGVKIDEFKSAEEQAMAILKLLQKLMPIKIMTKRFELRVPAAYTGKLYGFLKDFILKEDWLSDGSLLVVAEIPLKRQLEFFDKLNSITHGSVITKEL